MAHIASISPYPHIVVILPSDLLSTQQCDLIGVRAGCDWSSIHECLFPGRIFLRILKEMMGYYVPPQTTIQSPVHTIVGAPRASGASSTEMGLQVFVMGSYVPPVFKVCFPLNPPQTIIWFPVHTVV